MRIALFTDTYRPTVNGVANTLGRLVREAYERGHPVALISTRVSEEPAARTALHLQVAGVPVPMYQELQLARPLGRREAEEVEAFKPDLVHVATESTVGWSGRRWALRHGVPLVTSFHTDFPAYTRRYGLRMMEGGVWRYLRWFHGGARVSFCPSEATREMLLEHGFHPRWRIWSRGVDTDAFSPKHRKAEVRAALAPGAGTILLYVGRLAVEKRCDVAIEAFARIRDSFPRTALVFVGDGPDRDALERRRIPGVHFAGYRTGQDLAEAYAAADLFVFPSDTETFGNVVTEALASGLPVISSDRGGVRDTVIPGKTGVRCAAGDPEAFAQGIRCLLQDPERRRHLATGARQSAVARTWARVFDDLFAAYDEALHEGSHPARSPR